MYQAEGMLSPHPPFDFQKSLEFIGAFMPTKGEQTLADLSLTRAVRVNEQPFVFCVTSTGTLEKPQVRFELFSDAPINESEQMALCHRIESYLSLNDDLREFYQVGKEDPHFAPVINQLYGYHQVKFLTPFENACWAIISQRNLMTVSRKMKAALTETYGSKLDVEGVSYRAFPDAGQLVTADESELRQVIGNVWKAQGIRSIARAFDDVDEHWMETADYEEVYRWLRSIKGIGEWSASFILLRGLGRREQAPLNDKWLLEAASKVYGRTITVDDIQQLAKPYGQWQGYWAHYLRAAT
jgi:DNA-3-methyladenine glycosylase II